MSTPTPLALIHEAINIANAVAELGDDSFLAPDLRHEALAAAGDDLTQTVNHASVAQAAAHKATLAKRDAMEDVRSRIVRVRASVLGKFGSDSEEFHSMGGTRRSDRARPMRTPEASTSGASNGAVPH